MGAKKQQEKKKDKLDLSENTESEPSGAVKDTTKKSNKDEFVPPSSWGAPGDAGYRGFAAEFKAKLKADMGDEAYEKMGGKVATTKASEAYKDLDPQEKWEKWGGKPAPEKKEGPRGNFLVYRQAYTNEQKAAGRDVKEDKDDIMTEVKEKWANMTDEEKLKYVPKELTAEEKAEREQKKAQQKAKKEERLRKEEEKKAKSPAKKGKGRKAKMEPQEEEKHHEDSDESSPVRSRTRTKKSTRRKDDSESASPSKSRSPVKKTKSRTRPKREIEAEYAKKYEKFAKKKAYDVPISQWNVNGTKSTTTVSKMLSKHKVLLVSNVAYHGSLAKDHFEEFQFLAKEFKKDLGFLLFPCIDFKGVNDDEETMSENFAGTIKDQWVKDWNISICERVMVNGDDGTHPVIAHLKEIAGKHGKKIGLLKWNFDKFIINHEGEVEAYYIAKGNADAFTIKTPKQLKGEIGALIKAAKESKD